MLRAISARLSLEELALACLRRDIHQSSIICVKTSSSGIEDASGIKTVLLSDKVSNVRSNVRCKPQALASLSPPHSREQHSSPPPPPPPPNNNKKVITVAALALTASLGGVYWFRRGVQEEPLAIPLPPAPKVRAFPASAADLPSHVQYLIVGAGTAGAAALRTLRSLAPSASVLLVGEELLPPYARAPLSKEVWRRPPTSEDGLERLSYETRDGRRRPLLYEPAAYYGQHAARGWTMRRLRPDVREVDVAAGDMSATIRYDKCLLATGSSPIALSALDPLRSLGRCGPLHSAVDVAKAAKWLNHKDAAVAIIGSGTRAVELALSMAYDLPAEVVLVSEADSPLSEVLPQHLWGALNEELLHAGVKIYTKATVTSGEVNKDNRVLLRTNVDDKEQLINVDYVVECIGWQSNIPCEGVEMSLGGVAVGAELAGRGTMFAAGDVASYWSDAIHKRVRSTGHEHAVASGRRAAQNMAMEDSAQWKPYTHVPLEWADFGPRLGFEAMGNVDSNLPTVCIGPESGPLGPKVVLYKEPETGRVVGILTWNLFGRGNLARQVLQRGTFEEHELLNLGKHFLQRQKPTEDEEETEISMGADMATKAVNK